MASNTERNVILRKVQRLAVSAGDGGWAHLEVALTNAVRIGRYPPHVQAMLNSILSMLFAVMDECLPDRDK